MTKRFQFLSAAAIMACLSTSAMAVVTTTHLYQLGEADPGVFASGVGNATTIDSVGGNNLTRNGSPTVSSSAAASGSSLSMDFAGSGVSYSGTSISALTDNFGIEAWVRTQTNTGNHAIAYNGNTSNAGWGLYQIGGQYQALYGGKAIFGGAGVVLDTWTHLALVRDNGVATVYVNGVASGGTSATAPNAVGANPFFIGGNPGNAAESFNGTIDHVRSFSFAPGQFSAATDLSTARNGFIAQAHYRLGEHDPGASNGSIGNSVTIDDTGLRNLNRSGSPTYSGSTPGIVSTRSMDFSNASGENYSAGPVVTTATDNWVLEAWVNSDSAAAGVDIVAYNGNTSNSGFGLIRNGSEWQGLYGGRAILDFNASVTVDQWTHLALVREGGLVRLFVDGLQVGGALANGLNAPNGNFMIGGNPLNAGETFDGQIDEVRLSLLTAPFSIDNLLLNQNVIVPEPAVMSLVVMAGAALGLRRRRAA